MGASAPETGAPAGTVPPREAAAMLEAGRAALVDVREADEHAALRIPGAVSMPLSAFSPEALRGLAKPTVILHCKGGTRSADARRMALSAGGAGVEVLSLGGGIEGWRSAGFPVAVAAKSPPLSVMRQVQLVIGSGVLIGTLGGVFISRWMLVLPAFFGAGLLVAGASGTCGLAVLLGKMPWNRSGGICGR